MGLRSRIKGLVFGPQDPVRPPSAPTSTSTPTPTPMPTPTPTPTPTSTSTPPSTRTSADPEMRAKFEKIVAKAKLGVLEHVLKTSPDGAMSMADMHDHSERRYFIAHRSFSDLMETWIGEGLVHYDPESGTVTVTDAGRAFVGQNRK
jgi:hypothetical protein